MHGETLKFIYIRFFLFSATCFSNTFWPSSVRKIQVQKKTCYRRDLPSDWNLLKIH